jgi:flavin-dependent dehydrogenase
MRTDVLVVGAGPAGSALARQLAAGGVPVLLAERQRFPRDKPCGDFLSPQCQPLLEQLGLPRLLADLCAHRVDGMRLHDGTNVAPGAFRAVADDAPVCGFGVRRSAFDAALRNAATDQGVALLERHAFEALRRDGDGRICGARLRDADGRPVEVEARFVIGADGVHSRVARDLGVQRQERWLQQFALVAHFEGVAPLPSAEVHLLEGGFFAATTVEQGLFGVNLVLPQQALRARGERSWDTFVAERFDAAPAIAARLSAARRLAPWRGIGPFAYRTRTQAVPGAALVGDAAGYVDPLTGEGIYFALFGARALGRSVRRALDRPGDERSALRGYCRERQRELGPRLRVARLLQRGLRSPWVVRRVVAGLRRWPALADLVVTMSGDTVHPRQLWRPSFWRAFREARA